MDAINHQETEEIPIDYSAWPQVNEILCKRLSLPMEPKVAGGSGGLYPEKLLRYLKVDFRRVDPIFVGPKNGEKIYSLWGTDEATGSYSDSIGRRPLQKINTTDEVESYRWPKADWFDYSCMELECERFEPYAILGGAWSPIFCTACDLFGMETFLKNMYLKPEVVHAALDRITDFFLRC
ncbi:MAG: hypothetical protein ACUVTL_00325 [Thermoproteota archaeon]